MWWDLLSALGELSGKDWIVAALACACGGQAWFILRLLRRLSCTEELTRRAYESSISSANETSKLLLQGFAAAVRPLLSDLESERVNDWELQFPPDEPSETRD